MNKMIIKNILMIFLKLLKELNLPK